MKRPLHPLSAAKELVTMSADGDRVLTDRKLSESAYEHVIDVPFEQVDIAGWLFSLPNAEYERCCAPDHIACGYTTTDDGRPMSINVERIGGALIIQQYVAQVHRPDRCEMVSISDVFPPTGGHTKTQVNWTLSVEDLGDGRSTYTNSVVAYATQDFIDFLAETGGTFEAAAAARQASSGDHNRRETPLFAESIARWSLAKAGAPA
jgi:uncharacterized protein YndB with AHSA1/START domain